MSEKAGIHPKLRGRSIFSIQTRKIQGLENAAEKDAFV